MRPKAANHVISSPVTACDAKRPLGLVQVLAAHTNRQTGSRLNSITAGLVARDMRLSRYAEAAKRLEQVARKKPNDTVAHLFLAKCRFAMGDYELALAAAKAGLGNEPEDPYLLIQCAKCADAAGYDEQAYECAGRLLETEIAHVAIPDGKVMSLFRPIERLFGVSLINVLARGNRDRIRDYDWAKRYRRKYERCQTES